MDHVRFQPISRLNKPAKAARPPRKRCGPQRRVARRRDVRPDHERYIVNRDRLGVIQMLTPVPGPFVPYGMYGNREDVLAELAENLIVDFVIQGGRAIDVC